MITVAVMHSELVIDVLEGDVFTPSESASLKQAYDHAATSLAAEYELSDPARIKLAKIVLEIGRMAVAAERGPKTTLDVQAIASAASLRLLALGGGREVERLVR